MKNKEYFEHRGRLPGDFDHWRYGKFLGKYLDDLEVQKIEHALSDTRVDLLVDFGCGTGYHMEKLSNNDGIKNAVGIDFSNTYIEKAKKLCRHNDKVSFHCGDMNNLSGILRESSVDVFILIGFLQYLSDEEILSLAKKIDQFSKKDSKVIIKHPVHYGRSKIVKDTNRDGFKYTSEYKTFHDIVLPFLDYFDFKSMERIFHRNMMSSDQFNSLESIERCQQTLIVLDRQLP